MNAGRMGFAGVVACAMLGLGATAAMAAEKTAYLSLSGGAAFPAQDMLIGSGTTSEGVALTGDQIDASVGLETGYAVAPAVGMYVNQFRFEFQYTAQTNQTSEVMYHSLGISDSTHGSLRSNLFMLNAYYDFPITDRFSVYVGGGLGCNYMVADTWLDDVASSKDMFINNMHGTGFAGQIMTGVEYKLDPIFSVFAGYRGWKSKELRTQLVNFEAPWSSIVEIGIRASF